MKLVQNFNQNELPFGVINSLWKLVGGYVSVRGLLYFCMGVSGKPDAPPNDTQIKVTIELNLTVSREIFKDSNGKEFPIYSDHGAVDLLFGQGWGEET